MCGWEKHTSQFIWKEDFYLGFLSVGPKKPKDTEVIFQAQFLKVISMESLSNLLELDHTYTGQASL